MENKDSNDLPVPPDRHSHSTDKSSTNEKSAAGHDHDESRLVLERARWFGQRAGVLSDSASIVRLLKATELAVITPSDPREIVMSESLLAASKDPGRTEKSDVLLQDSQLRVNGVEELDGFQPHAFGTFGPVLTIGEVAPPFATLALPVSQQDYSELDLDTAAFCHWQPDREEASIVESSKFFAQDNLLVGRIHRPGRYQAIALPRHPLTHSVLRLIASHFQGLQFIGRIRYREEDDKRALALLEGLTALADSPADTFAALVRPIVERFAIEDPQRGTEPPLLKLWRLLQLKNDHWTCLGPFSGREVTSIGRVAQLDTHPNDGNTVLAATAGGGVWRTDDAGSSWYPLMEREPTLTMGAVSFAPSDPNTIYAASGEDAGNLNPAWPGAGVYRSETGGKSWTLAARVSSTRFSAIAVHPQMPFTLYAAGNRGLHRSLDGGVSWTLNDGLLSLFDGHVTDVVLDYDDPERVYIGVRNLGILRSVTGGVSVNGSPAFRLLQHPRLPRGHDAGWIKLALGRKGAHSWSVLVAKLGADGGRIFVSEDGGEEWTEKSSVGGGDFSQWTSVIAVDPHDSSKLYAGAALDKLHFSVNKGDSWDDLSIEVFEDQQDVAFDNKDSNRIFLANDGGVYRISLSPDEGVKALFASGGLSISQIYDLDISEKDAEAVACGAQDTALFYRNSQGEWRQNGHTDITQVAIDPTDSSIVYCAGPHNEDSVTLLHSKDGGRTLDARGTANLQERAPWVPIVKLHPEPEIDDPDNTREIFLCGSRTFFHSSDAGRSFRRVDYESGEAFIVEGNITALEFAPGDPSILYLGTSYGTLYRAGLGGLFADNWTQMKPTFPRSQIAAIAVDCRNADYVWIVLAGNGVTRLGRPEQDDSIGETAHVFRTDDGGRRWINATGRIMDMHLPDVPMSAIALDPFDSGVAYVGTDVGVFRTSDGGASWLAFQDGLPRSPVTELRLNRRNRTLFAATMGRGVFRRSLE